MISRFTEVLNKVQDIRATLAALGTPRPDAPHTFPADLARAMGAVEVPPFDRIIRAAAARHGLDPALVHAVVRAESGYTPEADSSAGAQGLMQLMPGTARSLGVTDPYDPVQNVFAGTGYLRAQIDRFQDVELALAAYNAGPAAVSRHGRVPPYRETHAYVRRVLSYWLGE